MPLPAALLRAVRRGSGPPPRSPSESRRATVNTRRAWLVMLAALFAMLLAFSLYTAAAAQTPGGHRCQLVVEVYRNGRWRYESGPTYIAGYCPTASATATPSPSPTASPSPTP